MSRFPTFCYEVKYVWNTSTERLCPHALVSITFSIKTQISFNTCQDVQLFAMKWSIFETHLLNVYVLGPWFLSHSRRLQAYSISTNIFFERRFDFQLFDQKISVEAFEFIIYVLMPLFPSHSWLKTITIYNLCVKTYVLKLFDTFEFIIYVLMPWFP